MSHNIRHPQVYTYPPTQASSAAGFKTPASDNHHCRFVVRTAMVIGLDPNIFIKLCVINRSPCGTRKIYQSSLMSQYDALTDDLLIPA